MTDTRSGVGPIGTIVRGKVAMWEGEVAGAPLGRPMKFSDTQSIA